MTVCIAAVCDRYKSPKIVVGVDWRISGALGSAETRLKHRRLCAGWSVLTSGYDSDILALVSALETEFLTRQRQELDETNIKPIIRKVLNARMKEKIEELVQGRWALSYDDFLAFGKDKLPPDLFRQTVADIADVALRTQCIIAGFLADGHPILLQTDEHCEVAIKEDFATIGEGAFLAQSVLLQRGHTDVNSLETTTYIVFEAKKYAERVSSVGQHTTIAIVDPDGDNSFLTDEGKTFLEGKYGEFGPRRLPKTIDAPEDYLRKYSKAKVST